MADSTEQKKDDESAAFLDLCDQQRDIPRHAGFITPDISGIEGPNVTIERNVTPGKEGVTIRFDHSRYMDNLERGTDTPPR